jgi:hypothetical protein
MLSPWFDFECSSTGLGASFSSMSVFIEILFVLSDPILETKKLAPVKTNKHTHIIITDTILVTENDWRDMLLFFFM